MGKFAAFLRDERGSHTIEFVIWIPLFLFFLAATIDASMIYLTHTEMWNVARDTARRATTGQIETNQEAYDHVASHMLLGDRNYYISPDVESGPEISIKIQTYVADASIFGIFGIFQNATGYTIWSLDAEVIMRKEPDLT